MKNRDKKGILVEKMLDITGACSQYAWYYWCVKTPCCHTHIWPNNVNCVKTTLCYWLKKSKGYHFFLILRKNNYLLPTHIPICKKIVHILENTLLSCPYFIKKTSILSKTRCSHVRFFNFFLKNPWLSCPYLVKQTSILSKLPYIMGQKSQ